MYLVTAKEISEISKHCVVCKSNVRWPIYKDQTLIKERGNIYCMLKII